MIIFDGTKSSLTNQRINFVMMAYDFLSGFGKSKGRSFRATRHFLLSPGTRILSPHRQPLKTLSTFIGTMERMYGRQWFNEEGVRLFIVPPKDTRKAFHLSSLLRCVISCPETNFSPHYRLYN